MDKFSIITSYKDEIYIDYHVKYAQVCACWLFLCQSISLIQIQENQPSNLKVSLFYMCASLCHNFIEILRILYYDYYIVCRFYSRMSERMRIYYFIRISF